MWKAKTIIPDKICQWLHLTLYTKNWSEKSWSFVSLLPPNTTIKSSKMAAEWKYFGCGCRKRAREGFKKRVDYEPLPPTPKVLPSGCARRCYDSSRTPRQHSRERKDCVTTLKNFCVGGYFKRSVELLLTLSFISFHVFYQSPDAKILAHRAFFRKK